MWTSGLRSHALVEQNTELSHLWSPLTDVNTKGVIRCWLTLLKMEWLSLIWSICRNTWSLRSIESGVQVYLFLWSFFPAMSHSDTLTCCFSPFGHLSELDISVQNTQVKMAFILWAAIRGQLNIRAVWGTSIAPVIVSASAHTHYQSLPLIKAASKEEAACLL